MVKALVLGHDLLKDTPNTPVGNSVGSNPTLVIYSLFFVPFPPSPPSSGPLLTHTPPTRRTRLPPTNMPTVPLHLSPSEPTTASTNPLPELLHTPSGLALIELQGTLNLPPPPPPSPPPPQPPTSPADGGVTAVGTFVFPQDPSSRKVWLYIGQHQRMTGEMKKLATPLGVVRRRIPTADRMEVETDGGEEGGGEGGERWEGEEIEIAGVVRWKIVFSGRPEPVGGM